MDLQNRFLSLNVKGDDVARLHRELQVIATRYDFAIPDDEIAEARFGQGTMAAVSQYQGKNDVRLRALSGAIEEDRWPGPRGVVDTATAAAIAEDARAMRPRAV